MLCSQQTGRRLKIQYIFRGIAPLFRYRKGPSRLSRPDRNLSGHVHILVLRCLMTAPEPVPDIFASGFKSGPCWSHSHPMKNYGLRHPGTNRPCRWKLSLRKHRGHLVSSDTLDLQKANNWAKRNLDHARDIRPLSLLPFSDGNCTALDGVPLSAIRARVYRIKVKPEDRT